MKNIAKDINIAPDGGFTGFGKLGLKDGSLATNADLTFSNMISTLIGVMTVVAAIWFLFLLITGAIGYMSSGGDKAAIETARKKILNAVIGFVIVIAAIFIIKLIGFLVGVDFLNFLNLFSIVGGTLVNP
jgi:hypothetical protein